MGGSDHSAASADGAEAVFRGQMAWPLALALGSIKQL